MTLTHSNLCGMLWNVQHAQMVLRVHRVLYLGGRVCKNIIIIFNITILKIYFIFYITVYNVTVLCNRRCGKRVRNALAISAVFTQWSWTFMRVSTSKMGRFEKPEKCNWRQFGRKWGGLWDFISHLRGVGYQIEALRVLESLPGLLLRICWQRGGSCCKLENIQVRN